VAPSYLYAESSATQGEEDEGMKKEGVGARGDSSSSSSSFSTEYAQPSLKPKPFRVDSSPGKLTGGMLSKPSTFGSSKVEDKDKQGQTHNDTGYSVPFAHSNNNKNNNDNNNVNYADAKTFDSTKSGEPKGEYLTPALNNNKNHNNHNHTYQKNVDDDDEYGSDDEEGDGKKKKKKGPRWEIEYDSLIIEKKIGQGAFGSVFKGVWRNTVVAIKTLRQDVTYLTASELEEFRREAKTMMNMRPHANVVQLFGVCTRPYSPLAIVVEFLEGGSLVDFLKSGASIDLEMALKMARDTAAGVAHLHAEGVVHRDLAARNLLLSSTHREYLHVKVSDFGMSRFTEADEDNVTKCKTGPLKWMPPESLQEQRYSFKSDVWAMGVVLWEIFSRKEPYPGTTPVQVAIQVSTKGVRLRPPAACPAPIAALMNDCWALDPKARPTLSEITKRIIDFQATNPSNYEIVSTNEEATWVPPRALPTTPSVRGSGSSVRGGRGSLAVPSLGSSGTRRSLPLPGTPGAPPNKPAPSNLAPKNNS